MAEVSKYYAKNRKFAGYIHNVLKNQGNYNNLKRKLSHKKVKFVPIFTIIIKIVRGSGVSQSLIYNYYWDIKKESVLLLVESGSEVQKGILLTSGETVEKVPKQTLGRDAEKNDFTECATINGLTMTKGRETPKNHALTILKGFSTVSEGVLFFRNPADPKVQFGASTYKSTAQYYSETW